MGHPQNLVQRAIVQRASELISQLEFAEDIEHNPTKGELRETAIRSSLRGIIPTGFDVCSGFVTDAYGTTSPQLDIVLYQKGTVSPVFLQNEAAIIPIESFRTAIEVKSTLRTADLEQIATQCETVTRMFNSTFLGGGSPKTSSTFIFQKNPPPMFLMAYKNEVALETLKSAVAKIENLFAIFLVDENPVMKSGNDAIVVTDYKTDIDRVLFAWASIFNACLDLSVFVSVGEDKMVQIKSWLSENRPDINPDDPKVVQRIFTPNIQPYLFTQILPRSENPAEKE